MIKFKWIYIAIGVLLLSLIGCEKLIFDQTNEETPGAEPKVHLSVNVRAAQPKSGLRAAEGPSINTDRTDHEDKVYDLAMLIFNSDVKGERVGIVHLNNNLGSGISTRAFQVELTAGKKYDFYFVANMPDMRVDLTEAKILDRAAMDSYLQRVNGVTRELGSTLYQGASDTEGFPMARIYKNQLVEAGGTIYQPKPFYPKQYGNEEYTVVANSGGAGDDTREYVELIRVVAKLEVNLDLDEEASLGVDKVYFRNANRHFRLVEFETAPEAYFNDNETNTELRQLENTNTYIYYMPEAINVSDATWSPDASADNKPINYFTVTTNGVEYDIPIITYDGVIPEDNYLAFATGARAESLYSIYRNRHYKFTIKNLQKIEIFYEIDPWVKVNKSLYMGFGYNVEVDGTNITVSNTIQACAPHKVRLETVSPYLFDDGSNTKEFDTLDTTASKPFKLNIEPVVEHEYLKVYYNDILVKTFTKK